MNLKAALAEAEKVKLAALDSWIQASDPQEESRWKKRFDEAEGRCAALKAKMVTPEQKHIDDTIEGLERNAEQIGNPFLKQVSESLARQVRNYRPKSAVQFAVLLITPLCAAYEQIAELEKRLAALEAERE